MKLRKAVFSFVMGASCSREENSTIWGSWGQRCGRARLWCTLSDRQGGSRTDKAVLWPLAFWRRNSGHQRPFIAEPAALYPQPLTLSSNIWTPQETITPVITILCYSLKNSTLYIWKGNSRKHKSPYSEIYSWSLGHACHLKETQVPTLHYSNRENLKVAEQRWLVG